GVPQHAASAGGRLRVGGGRAVHRRPHPGDPAGATGGAGRLTAWQPGPAQAGARPRRAVPPRLRHAGRRQGHGRARARPPAHPPAGAGGDQRVGGAGGRRPALTDSPAARRDAVTASWHVTRLGPAWLMLVALALLLGVVVGRAELFVAI